MEQRTGGRTTLFLIRHTDVENPEDILYGRLPRFGLSELGLRQAEVTARVLADEPIAAFYSSPRLRARQTVQIMALLHPGVPVHFTRLLDEVRTSWQGRPHSELEEITFDFYGKPLGPSDEKLAEVWSRVERFIRRVRTRHAGEMVAAVSHGDPVILARAYYSGMPITVESLRRPNVYPGKGSILRLSFAADPGETYPFSLEYYDPNGDEGPWTRDWVSWRAGEPMPTG